MGRLWLARLALALSALILPLLGLEIALRVFGPIIPGNYETGAFLVPHPIYGTFHQPNFSGWLHSPEFVTQIKTNSIGLRNEEVAVPKPVGTYRVLLVGDSFTEGAQVPAEKTFTKLMENALNTASEDGARPRYEVINAGVRGWGPPEEYLWLKNEGLGLQPDLVVVYFYVGNDVYDSGCRFHGSREERLRACFYFRRDGNLYQEDLRPRTFTSWDLLRTSLRHNSVLSNVVASAADLHVLGAATWWQATAGVYASPQSGRQQSEWDEAWRVAEALLRSMKQDSEARGVKFAWAATPTVFEVDRGEWERALEEQQLDPAEFDLDGPNRRLAGTAANVGAPYLDLRPPLRQEAATSPDPLFYPQDRHYTPAGHAIVARHLLAFLQSNGLLQ